MVQEGGLDGFFVRSLNVGVGLVVHGVDWSLPGFSTAVSYEISISCLHGVGVAWNVNLGIDHDTALESIGLELDHIVVVVVEIGSPCTLDEVALRLFTVLESPALGVGGVQVENVELGERQRVDLALEVGLCQEVAGGVKENLAPRKNWRVGNVAVVNGVGLAIAGELRMHVGHLDHGGKGAGCAEVVLACDVDTSGVDDESIRLVELQNIVLLRF